MPVLPLTFRLQHPTGAFPVGKEASFRSREGSMWVVCGECAQWSRVVFAIAELDSAYTNKTVLLADRVNGGPLSAEAGPARIIVSDEKHRSRWIRQVWRIRVLSAPAADERPCVQMPR